MIILNEDTLNNYSAPKSVALGNFDGIHLGHQKLIKKAVEMSKLRELKSAVFTFKQHTSQILRPEKKINLITTLRKKIEILSNYNIDYGIFFNFTKEFSRIMPDDYINDILIKKLNSKIIIAGEDYRFGYKGTGNINTLQKYADKGKFDLIVINKVKVDGIVVSSSYIRGLIKSGNVETASKYLGRYFNLEGIVIKGKQIGRQLGFPTVNIKIDNNIILPQYGVYVTRIKISNKYYLGVTNIGDNPTFNQDSVTIESFIIDFSSEIYNEFIEIEFISKIRNEIKFKDIESLKIQIQKDINYAKKYKNILQV
ncbi:MAG: bifunctional riboflavin kinase/FAD synthetase [Thermoanaerobacteraceae bacterium]